MIKNNSYFVFMVLNVCLKYTWNKKKNLYETLIVPIITEKNTLIDNNR